VRASSGSRCIFMRKPGRGPRPEPVVLTSPRAAMAVCLHCCEGDQPPLRHPSRSTLLVRSTAFQRHRAVLPGFGFPARSIGFRTSTSGGLRPLAPLMTETWDNEKYGRRAANIGGIVTSQLGVHQYTERVVRPSTSVRRAGRSLTSSPPPCLGLSPGIGPTATKPAYVRARII